MEKEVKEEIATKRAKLSDAQWNRELMADFFESVYNTMKNARGNRGSLRNSDYIDREKLLALMDQALQKAEAEAMDTWRDSRK